ncbi:MAG: His/Gly/Thr/Pro-type tRNA ligase C-terminal domain-containing protein, partial [Acidobacteriota bacterium]|nr:His/Gly/Thr/Pro-type tRNA ligase C-terminal domain-containing protein [Acidobacteriota bacterium]
VMLDDREEHSPGWKYAEWEMRGVPVRLEIGPRDIKNEQVMLVRRDTREKTPTPMAGLAAEVKTRLDEIQQALFDRAVAFRDEHTFATTDRAQFDATFEGRPGYVVAPWCGSSECEAQIKTATQATISNLPLDPSPASGVCFQCGQSGQVDAYFAKSY